MITRENDNEKKNLTFTINASKDSPVVNPAFVIHNWGREDASLILNGEPIQQSKDFRFGHYHRLEGSDLIVWMKMESENPMTILLK